MSLLAVPKSHHFFTVAVKPKIIDVNNKIKLAYTFKTSKLGKYAILASDLPLKK